MHRLSLKFLICFQLVFAPLAALPDPLSPETKRQLRSAENFNKQVESLRAHVLGTARSREGLHTTHPLDLFSLLSQNPKPVPAAAKKAAPDQEETQNEITDESKNEITKTEMSPQEHLEEQTEEKAAIKDKILSKIPRKEDVLAKIPKISKEKYKIRDETLFVEALDPETKSPGAIISMAEPSDVESFLPKKLQALYADQAIVSDSPFEFKLKTYNQTQVNHSFSNQALWMAFVGPYLVFMEPSQFYEHEKGKTALISFIDLSYFRELIGQGALPIFRIPIPSDLREKHSFLFSPGEVRKIEINYEGLKLKGPRQEPYEIPIPVLNTLSEFQQLYYSVVLSLLNIDRYDRDYLPFIRSISDIQNKQTRKTRLFMESSSQVFQEAGEIFKKELEFLSQNNKTEQKTAQVKLEIEKANLDKKAKNILEQLKNNLKVQEKIKNAAGLQKMIKANNQRMFNRIQALMLKLIAPQPISSEPILEALGLISGSRKKGETKQEHFQKMLEELPKNGAEALRRRPYLSTSLLLGMSAAAAPEMASFYASTLQGVGLWFWDGLQLLTQATTGIAKGAAPSSLSSAYLAEGQWEHLRTGLTWLLGSIAVVVLGTHSLVNINQYRKFARENPNEIDEKNFTDRFILFQKRSREDFIKNMSEATQSEIGFPGILKFGDEPVKMLFKTTSQRSKLLGDLKNSENLKAVIQSVDGIETELELSKTASNQEKVIEIGFKKENGQYLRRSFVAASGNGWGHLFNEEGYFVTGALLEIESRDKSGALQAFYQGVLVNASYSDEDEKKIAKKKKDLELKKQSTFFYKLKKLARASASSKDISSKDIDNFRKASMAFLLSYPSWTHTFAANAKFWNKWFLIRTYLLRPLQGPALLSYPKMFDRFLNQRHFPSHLNGGFDLRLASGKEHLKYIEDREMKTAEVEAKIIEAERQAQRVSAEAIYQQMLEEWPRLSEKEKRQLDPVLADGVKKHIGPTDYLSVEFHEKANYSLNLGEPALVPSKKDLPKEKRFFYKLLQTQLIELYMVDLIQERLGLEPDLNAKQIKEKMIEFYHNEGGEKLDLSESLDEARLRTAKILKESDVTEKTQRMSQNFLKSFIPKLHQGIEKSLDPSQNLSMERYSSTEEMLKNPIAVLRAVRHSISRFTLDKPIELITTFILLSAVDQAVLKPLHEEMFSENSFFHLSRYAIWGGFYANFVLDFYGITWEKFQMDSRLASKGGFKEIPTIEDIEKRFAKTRYFFKQKISLKEDYKLSWRIILSNWRAALPSFAIVYLASMGRFDLEFYLATYLVFCLLPIYALYIKFNNQFESFSNIALGPYIEALKITKKDDHRLAHPTLIEHNVKESHIQRMWFNWWFLFLFENPSHAWVNNLASMKSFEYFRWLFRPFQAIPYAGDYFAVRPLPTYWMADGLEALKGVGEKIPGGEKFLNGCIKIFTKNKGLPDLPD